MRLPVDLLVLELVVDSKVYPSGYEVQLRTRVEKGAKSQLALPVPASAAGDDAGAPPAQDETALPVACAAYTMPPSPLHSAGLNADRPPCHLLRLTLPTAQYQVSTIEDPLTGETRTAPVKPQWMLDLEDGRAVVDVQIRPAATGSEGKAKLQNVVVDGNVVPVLSEKESLTSLGRDELLDGRTSKMDLLVR